MKQSVSQIWIEAEEWADGEWNIDDDNSDVIVTLANGEKWIATFFTYKNIMTLKEGHRTTGECLDGIYFWASDMILIDELTRDKIERVVKELIATENFMTAFSPI